MDTSKATARPWEVLSTATKNPRTSEWREIRSGVAGVVRCDSFDVHRSGESYTECGVRISAADAALIVRAVNSHEALVAALRSIPPSPVSRPVTSAEWEVADRFEGFFNAFEGTAVRSIRSAAYERGMADGKQARAALALAEQGGG